MDWILVLLALFNLGSMWVAYRDRCTVRPEVPWVLYFYSLVATELSWLWLPTQFSIAVFLSFSGALSSVLGLVALLGLIMSWIPLGKSVLNSFNAVDLTENSLKKALGREYKQLIPEDRRLLLESDVTFQDWCSPFQMERPGVEVIRDIPYGPLGVKHKLDIYKPIDMPKQNCPVLLQIHGGAWTVGSKEHQGLPLMHYLATKGWICVAINYRLSPSVGFPTELEDCKRALTWIRTEGKKYGMDTDFVAVSGGSAGGHLASMLALTANMPELQKQFPDIDTSIQAAVPLYGVYDMLDRYDSSDDQMVTAFVQDRVIFETPEQNPYLWDLMSPITHVGKESPAFMIVQGEVDSLTTVERARVFKQKIAEISENSVVYLELPGAEHAFDCIHSPRTDAVIRGVHRFLEWEMARQKST
jgi:acetyl esterase/lipase